MFVLFTGFEQKAEFLGCIFIGSWPDKEKIYRQGYGFIVQL